jgi:hypothetical protein
MKSIKLCIILGVLLLSGCDRQKSHQEMVEDINKLEESYKSCVSDGFAKKGDIFCKYILEAPEEMYDLLQMGKKDPQSLGGKVLKLQQEIGILKKSVNAEDQKIFKVKKLQLDRCYLVLKLLSSIK